MAYSVLISGRTTLTQADRLYDLYIVVPQDEQGIALMLYEDDYDDITVHCLGKNHGRSPWLSLVYDLRSVSRG